MDYTWKLCKIIDLYNYKIPYDSIDGSHPTNDGMDTIAQLVINGMLDFKDERFLCSEGNFIREDKGSKDKFLGKTIVKRYLVRQLQGTSYLYRTYIVEDNIFNKICVMIIYDKTKPESSSFLEKVRKEACFMKSLNHPTMWIVEDIIEDEENLFIIRECINGKSLNDIVKTFGPQSTENVIAWSMILCDLLSYLHNFTPPYIYSDMKPSNIYLNNNYLKVINFENVRAYDGRSGDVLELGIISGYEAPEQYGNYNPIDVRTDIFGLGMTMYYLATGIDPKEPPHEIHSICKINPLINKGLEYIILKCIEINPENRYQNCDELMKDLNNYLNLPKNKGIFEKVFRKKKNQRLKK